MDAYLCEIANGGITTMRRLLTILMLCSFPVAAILAESLSPSPAMQPILSTSSESHSNSDSTRDRSVGKMKVRYQKLSEQYANFLVAVGGVSITVLALVLSLGSASSGSSPAERYSRAFLVVALLTATVSCF